MTVLTEDPVSREECDELQALLQKFCPDLTCAVVPGVQNVDVERTQLQTQAESNPHWENKVKFKYVVKAVCKVDDKDYIANGIIDIDEVVRREQESLNGKDRVQYVADMLSQADTIKVTVESVEDDSN